MILFQTKLYCLKTVNLHFYCNLPFTMLVAYFLKNMEYSYGTVFAHFQSVISYGFCDFIFILLYIFFSTASLVPHTIYICPHAYIRLFLREILAPGWKEKDWYNITILIMDPTIYEKLQMLIMSSKQCWVLDLHYISHFNYKRTYCHYRLKALCLWFLSFIFVHILYCLFGIKLISQ